MVYLREAHAADSDWPMRVPDEEPINTHKSLADRQAVANKCCKKLNIKIPCLIDDMENTTDKAYSAHPDRIFVVDKEGRIAVRAEPGPWGFELGVRKARRWLRAEFPKVEASERSNKTTPPEAG